MCEAISYQRKKYLTTKQLAELFEVEQKIMSRNFQRNSEKYKEGKHYILLKGNDLKEFKKNCKQQELMKYVSILYLWSKEGAILLAKSCVTDKAWESLDSELDEIFKQG